MNSFSPLLFFVSTLCSQSSFSEISDGSVIRREDTCVLSPRRRDVWAVQRVEGIYIRPRKCNSLPISYMCVVSSSTSLIFFSIVSTFIHTHTYTYLLHLNHPLSFPLFFTLFYSVFIPYHLWLFSFLFLRHFSSHPLRLFFQPLIQSTLHQPGARNYMFS